MVWVAEYTDVWMLLKGLLGVFGSDWKTSIFYSPLGLSERAATYE
jgi:hypothetical protein